MKRLLENILYVIAQYGFGVLLLFKAPLALARVLKAYVEAVKNKDFIAFGRKDVAFRGWYSKIAADYKEYGRYGFAYEDGLGTPLGPRIYNNRATYKVLSVLGTGRMCFLGYALFVAVVAVCSFFTLPWEMAALISVFIAISPLVFLSYTHFCKPEVFWFFLSFLILFLVLKGFLLSAAVLWSFLVFVNVPQGIILLLMIAPYGLMQGVLQADILWPLTGALPGAAKFLYRFIEMRQSSFYNQISTEQRVVNRKPWLDIADELGTFLLPATAAYLALGDFVQAGLFILPGFFVYILNFRVIYLNDRQIFYMFALCLNISLALAFPSPATLFLAALHSLRLYDFGGVSRAWNKHRIFSHVIRAYPFLEPCTYQTFAKFGQMLSRIPPHGRFLTEYDGDLRDRSIYRRLWGVADNLTLGPRQDLINDMYLRITDPLFNRDYISGLRPEGMKIDEIKAFMSALGCAHIFVYSQEYRDFLIQGGFREISRLAPADEPALWHYSECPQKPLYLLQHPGNDIFIISDIPSLNLKEGLFSWWTETPKIFKIRAHYSVKFFARLNGHERLEVKPYKPFKDIDMHFAQVKVPQKGLVEFGYDPALKRKTV